MILILRKAALRAVKNHLVTMCMGQRFSSLIMNESCQISALAHDYVYEESLSVIVFIFHKHVVGDMHRINAENAKKQTNCNINVTKILIEAIR